jgi:hypothetical protein
VFERKQVSELAECQAMMMTSMDEADILNALRYSRVWLVGLFLVPRGKSGEQDWNYKKRQETPTQ